MSEKKTTLSTDKRVTLNAKLTGADWIILFIQWLVLLCVNVVTDRKNCRLVFYFYCIKQNVKKSQADSKSEDKWVWYVRQLLASYGKRRFSKIPSIIYK